MTTRNDLLHQLPSAFQTGLPPSRPRPRPRKQLPGRGATLVGRPGNTQEMTLSKKGRYICLFSHLIGRFDSRQSFQVYVVSSPSVNKARGRLLPGVRISAIREGNTGRATTALSSWGPGRAQCVWPLWCDVRILQCRRSLIGNSFS